MPNGNRINSNVGRGVRSDQISPGLRGHVVGNHIVFYEQFSAGIRIVRVASGWRS